LQRGSGWAGQRIEAWVPGERLVDQATRFRKIA
jgi:hypothetical protein